MPNPGALPEWRDIRRTNEPTMFGTARPVDHITNTTTRATTADMARKDSRNYLDDNQRTDRSPTRSRKGHAFTKRRTPSLGSLLGSTGITDLPVKKLDWPVDESNRQDLCNTRALTSSAPVFRTTCVIEGHETLAMIDSGASGTFISEKFVQQHGLATCKKKDGGYELSAVDGSPLPDVDSETTPLSLKFQQHHEKIVLDVVPMARHDIVLGTPWLERHNPSIDWKSRVLKFERCGCVASTYPARRKNTTADEERQICDSDRQPTTKLQISSGSTDTDLAQTDQQVRTTGGTDAPPEIPEEFKRWKRLFQEEEGLAALPKHRPWDHRIELLPGKEPPWGPLYALSEKELQEQRKWLDQMLSKGWIRKSKSPAASLAMFVLKKGGKLRMVIDYRRLNALTIKNRYLLPNIAKITDRLTRA